MNKDIFTMATSILRGSLFGFALILGVASSLSAPSVQAACDLSADAELGAGTCEPGGDPGGPGASPSVSITATPLGIESGRSSQLSFNSSGVTRCVIDNGIGIVPENMSATRMVSPTQSTTYTISCDAPMEVVTNQVNVTVVPAPQPVSAYCSAGPETAQINETIQWSSFPSTGSSNLTWKRGTSYYTKICTGGQNYTSVGDCGDIGGETCSPEGARCRESSGCDGNTYTDPSGERNAHTAYGMVTPYRCTADAGSTNTYSWSGTDGLSGTTQNVSKAYTTAGTKTGQVTISASSGGSAVATCTANIIGQTPTATLTASPSSVSLGSASTLTWSSTNAASCRLNESIGTVATSGSRSVSPGGTTTYTLVCSAPGTATAGTWQYYGEEYNDYSCPLTQPYKSYSYLADCPSNPQGQTCTGNQLCKINVDSGYACTVKTTLYECTGTASSPAQNATATATVNVSSCVTSPQNGRNVNSTYHDGSQVTLYVDPTQTDTNNYTTRDQAINKCVNACKDAGYYKCNFRYDSAVTSYQQQHPYVNPGMLCQGVAGPPSSPSGTGPLERRVGLADNDSDPNWTSISFDTNSCAPSSVSCAVSRTSVLPGESVTYTASPSGGAGAPYGWTSTSGTGFGTAATATRTFTGQGNYDMRVSASGVATAANCPFVSVAACPGTRTANIDAVPARVNAGGTVTLNWQASAINSRCTITGPTGTLYTSNATSCNVPDGTITATVTAQSTYTISCDNGAITDSVIVNVVPKIKEF